MERFALRPNIQTESSPQIRLTDAQVGLRILSVVDFYRSHGLDPRLIGSTGRYAALRQDPPDTRTQEGGRDFDFVILTTRTQRRERGFRDLLTEAKAHTFPIHLDLFQQVSQGIILERGHSYIRYRDISLEVDQRVFESRRGHIFGVDVPTFDPNTLFHLQALFAGSRREDIPKLLEFRQQLMKLEDILPENLFAPFHEMAALRRTRYPNDILFNEFTAFYRAHLPRDFRKSVNPVAKKIKQAFFER